MAFKSKHVPILVEEGEKNSIIRIQICMMIKDIDIALSIFTFHTQFEKTNFSTRDVYRIRPCIKLIFFQEKKKVLWFETKEVFIWLTVQYLARKKMFSQCRHNTILCIFTCLMFFTPYTTNSFVFVPGFCLTIFLKGQLFLKYNCRKKTWNLCYHLKCIR